MNNKKIKNWKKINFKYILVLILSVERAVCTFNAYCIVRLKEKIKNEK